MAIQSTFTASEANPGIKEVQVGVQSKTSLLTLSTTATASSLFLLCKVPDGAQILDFMFFVDSAAANSTWELGVQQPEGSVSWTLSQSAISPAQGENYLRPQGINLPYTVSISSECQTRFAWITAVNNTAISASVIMRTTLFYTMDGS